MSDIRKEAEHDKVNLPPLPLVKNEPSIIEKGLGSLEAGNHSTKQRAESDHVTSLSDCPINNVKTEVLDDASLLEDEWSGGAGCLSYVAALTKQELDIGPTELQPPDMHFMLQPCKPDPDYHKPSLIVEDIPQGHELLPSEEEEFTERPDNDLPLRNSPEILPQGMCGSMSPHIQRVQTVSQSAHTDTPKQINPHNELLAHSSISSDSIKHIRVHTGEKRLKCKTCNKSFSQNNSLTKHIRTHTADKPFECKTCGKRFSLKGGLTVHMRMHTGEKPFKCKTCDKRFSHNSPLIRHIRTHTAEKPFKCKTCGKMFSDGHYLTIHIRTHTGEKPFKCKTCGKRFNRKDILIGHMRVHTGEKSLKCKILKSFECKTCGKRFNGKPNLTSHMRVHTGEKPFECNTCGKRFSKKHNLAVHIRIHTGEKPFECKICRRRFNRNNLLTAHIRVHTGEKPFDCKTCGKRYRRKLNLATHVGAYCRKTL